MVVAFCLCYQHRHNHHIRRKITQISHDPKVFPYAEAKFTPIRTEASPSAIFPSFSCVFSINLDMMTCMYNMKFVCKYLYGFRILGPQFSYGLVLAVDSGIHCLFGHLRLEFEIQKCYERPLSVFQNLSFWVWFQKNLDTNILLFFGAHKLP